MTVVPAYVAEVEEIVVCTPPRTDGSVHPAVLYAAKQAGATRVVKVGGAQAIAAMAFGTDSVPAVDKVVGPGNAYVTEAKRQLSGVVGVDGLAGPTELVLVASAEADPRWVAADLVAQAEHDPDAAATLVALDEATIEGVERALDAEVARAARREVVEAALKHARAVLVGDLEQAVEVVNDLAPEHLQLMVEDAGPFAERGPERRRDLRRRVHAGPVRRLRRRLEPRPSHRGDGAVRERAPRGRLREGDVGRRDGRRGGANARARGLRDRADRGARGPRPGGRDPRAGSA